MSERGMTPIGDVLRGEIVPGPAQTLSSDYQRKADAGEKALYAQGRLGIGVAQLAEALAKAQGEMEGAKKDTQNPFFHSRYADLASVWDACRGPLSKNGLSVIQKASCRFVGEPKPYAWVSKNGEEREGIRMPTEVIVATMLLHSSGQSVESSLSCMLADADPQKVGSAVTYLRRYGLQATVGICPEDDDAEGASDHGKDEPKAKGVDADIISAAEELAGRTGRTAALEIVDASRFAGKDGKEMSFDDPRRVRSEKWKLGVLGKLRDKLLASEDGEVPF